MMTRLSCVLSAVVLSALLPAARAEDVPEKYRPAVEKGLKWLVKQQQADGHWGATNDQYPTAMTAFAGMALLAEGSTPSKGKYAEPLRKAVDWLLDRSRRGGAHDGLIEDLGEPGASSRYMFGHGYATAFLSMALDGMDADRRRRAKDVLNRAVRYTASAQTTRGGWGYITAKDGNDFDEGACTIATIQGIHAARLAGIPVSRDMLKKAHDYMKQSTTPRGGVIYSLAVGGGGTERPALTAGALGVNGAGDPGGELARKWHEYCRTSIPLAGAGRLGFDEYIYYYYSLAIYALGDRGWAKLFPASQEADRITWTKYRTALFDHLQRTQSADGTWSGGATGSSIGPVYTTAMYLIVLQLDRVHIPVARP